MNLYGFTNYVLLEFRDKVYVILELRLRSVDLNFEFRE